MCSQNHEPRRCTMSKKKTTTSKPEATRPTVIPIMRSRGGKKKAQVGDAPTMETAPADNVSTNASPDQPVPTTESPSVPAAAPMNSATGATPADAVGSTKKRKAKAAKEPKPK